MPRGQRTQENGPGDDPCRDRIVYPLQVHGLRRRVPGYAFREGRNMLVIDPDACIDCALCVPECPVNAIFLDDDLPPAQLGFLDINARLSRTWPPITRGKGALPDADSWAAVSGKRAMLDEG